MGKAENNSLNERMKDLVGTLDLAAKAYYQESREIMSNYEYDKLYDELLQLEAETGIVMAGSPTAKVGYEILSDLPKEKHASRMLSLDKTKEVEALKDWLGSHKGLLSWKLDGLTIVLTYEGGQLIKAVTRGNGDIGEVITNNAKVFDNLPLRIPYEGKLVLRGEAVIKYSDFEKINAEITDASAKYKNPRNLCSGTVRQLDNRITAQRHVNFFAFSMVESDEEFSSREEQLKALKDMGFETVEYRAVENGSQLAEAVAYFAEKITGNDFPSDGLVLIYDDIEYGKSLGKTAKFPRDAIAFKWQDETMETVLKEIEWNTPRTALINPVAIFEPVELEGTTVSRASVHNVSIMKEMQLGIGDTIKVYKANMIIPQIAENKTRSGNVIVPEKCPVCGHPTQIKSDNGVEALYCVNPDCLAKHVKSFTHFVSRDAMNIEGLSEATIEKFIAQGIIKEFADIFRLNRHEEIITKMEGFGNKSFANLCAAADKARKTTTARLLYSLGISGIGVANAKLISAACKHDWSKIESLKQEELVEIQGIGDIMAQSYVEFFAKEENKHIVADIIEEIEFEEIEEASGEQIFEGKTFVITGSLNGFSNRKELQALIESKGGKVAGSVSNKTSYLINNDKMSNSSKNKTAKELGVAIISEEDFMQML